MTVVEIESKASMAKISEPTEEDGAILVGD